MPPAPRTISPSGQNVIPSPYARQCPVRNVARPSARATSSLARRDLPSPGTPRIVKSRHERSSSTRASAPARRSSSVARPTNGPSSLRTTPVAARSTSLSRQASTGSLLPLRLSGSTGSASTAPATSRCVSRPIRTPPAPAAASSRFAVFTTSPVTIVEAAAASPATTSPVLIPIRISSSTPHVASSSPFSRESLSRISAAARTARSASSSCTTGTPKTAMTASPMNFSTVPPWASIAARISSK